jgi:endonuclease III
MAKRVHDGPWKSDKFSKNDRANEIINDIGKRPHVFVMGCILGHRVHDDKGWETLAYLEERIGTLDIKKLSRLTLADWEKAFMKPTPLHRFYYESARDILAAIQRITREYEGDASRIWSHSPSSATVIKRFLEFDGIGQRTSTMAADILARYFKIPMSDYYSIEATVDPSAKRVLARMGVVESKKPIYIQLTLREMYPKYPGIFDPVLWKIGKYHCFPTKPNCPECPVHELCLYSLERVRSSGTPVEVF